jgi:hypothetical protein
MRLPDDGARLFYLLLLTQCDSHGFSNAAPHYLNARVWPLLGRNLEDTQRTLVECAKVGLVNLYQDGTERWLHVPDWEEKAGSNIRKDKRGKPKFSAPEKFRVQVGPTPAPVQDHAVPSPAEGPGTAEQSGTGTRIDERNETDEREQTEQSKSGPTPGSRRAVLERERLGQEGSHEGTA